MSFVSVIVPCYNQAQYLEEALQSVYDQSYTDWECIIVDDGSPDDTEIVAKLWCGKDDRFKYVKKGNGGISSARNAGIEEAIGEWILPLDADDFITKDYIKYAVEAIEVNPNLGVIYGDAYLFEGKIGPFELLNYNFSRLLRLNMIHCSAFFKKEDWCKVGGYDTNLVYGLEDWEFWINLIGSTKKEVLKINYVGLYYRIKHTSRNQTVFLDEEKKKAINIYVLKKHLDLYIREFGTYQNILDMNDQLIYNNNVLIGLINKREKFLIVKVYRKIQLLYKRLFNK